MQEFYILRGKTSWSSKNCMQPKPQKRTFVTVCKYMRGLQKKCIVTELQVEQLEHEKTLLGFRTGKDEQNKEKLLLLSQKNG